MSHFLNEQGVAWANFPSSASVRRHDFIPGRPVDASRERAPVGLRETLRDGATASSVLRDGLFSWDTDWTRRTNP